MKPVVSWNNRVETSVNPGVSLMPVEPLRGVVRDLCTLASHGEGESPPDGQLLRDFADRGDAAAFAVLVRRHGPMVFGVCQRMLRQVQDAEDAFQATFLVLVRKAAALGPREILGNWLYGVAYHTALKARATAARRAREKTMPPPPPPSEPPDPDALALLDRELQVLPERYRTPLVLCDLQGKTYKTAAAELGCPEGTVAGRLARARALLAKRLTRRGITVSVAALPAVLVPPLLTAATVRLASTKASPAVASLADAAMKALLLKRIKTAGLVAASLAGLGLASAALWCAMAFGGAAGAGAVLATKKDPRPVEDPKPQAKVEVIPLANVPWRRPILLDKSEETGEVDIGQEAKPWIDKALQTRGEDAVVPGFRPLVVGDLVLYRTFNDMRVVYRREQRADGFKPGEFHWKGTMAEGGLANVMADGRYRHTVTRWLKDSLAGDLPQMLLENSLAHAFSHDDQRVYWVDQLSVLAPPNFNAKLPEHLKELDALRHLNHRNNLWAMNLDSGKLLWRLSRDSLHEDPIDPFASSHFLGAPLPLGGKLYVQDETGKGELRLVVLEAATGKVDGIHVLDWVDEPRRFLVSELRSVNAVQLVGADGLLVCCTHAGKVIGVEVPKFKVRWTQTYRKEAPPAGLGFWKHPSPCVHDGKVVFTAADDEHVHCVSLKDGAPLWKVRQADDLYAAGIVGDKVLLVGRAACRALALKDGREAWKLDTGTPSGLGAFRKSTYLLPLKKGAASKQPEIAYLDAEHGKLIGTSPLKEAPGNLVLAGDEVFSQSNTEITAFVPEKRK
jgi:RNA polymerase sigma factor (sigma-70 family)